MICSLKNSLKRFLTGDHKKAIVLLLLIISINARCQELVSREYEKGYLKEGQKVLVWEYSNSRGELELKINHSSGRVYFLKEDTSQYVILKDSVWVKEQLRIYPIPVEGYVNFRMNVARKIRYPLEARHRGIEGDVSIIFEVDSSGIPGNYRIWHDIGSGCGDAVITALRRAETAWVPATIEGKKYSSRFSFPVTFRMEDDTLATPAPEGPLAKKLGKTVVSIKEGSGKSGSGHYRTKKYYTLKDALNSRGRVEYLSLGGFEFETFPRDVAKLKYLVHLDLERNSLTEVDGIIGTLQKLEELYLPANKLSTLPVELTTLPKLKVLGLALNQFTEFPEEVCSCLELEALDLGDNKISNIPACIGQMKKLRMIVLNGNHIRSLPDEFYALKKLKVVLIKNNPVTPETIERLQSTFGKGAVLWE